MANLTFNNIFGSNAFIQRDLNPDGSETVNIKIDPENFQSVGDGSGEIANSLGFDDIYQIQDLEGKAINLLYAILLLAKQNQASAKDADPEQKIYIQESGTSIVSFGDRKGQLERKFTVSFFSSNTFENTADIDSI